VPQHFYLLEGVPRRAVPQRASSGGPTKDYANRVMPQLPWILHRSWRIDEDGDGS
jgi:hypothetical protein